MVPNYLCGTSLLSVKRARNDKKESIEQSLTCHKLRLCYPSNLLLDYSAVNLPNTRVLIYLLLIIPKKVSQIVANRKSYMIDINVKFTTNRCKIKPTILQRFKDLLIYYMLLYYNANLEHKPDFSQKTTYLSIDM